jgi:hypothetical protein
MDMNSRILLELGSSTSWTLSLLIWFQPIFGRSTWHVYATTRNLTIKDESERFEDASIKDFHKDFEKLEYVRIVQTVGSSLGGIPNGSNLKE